MPTRSLFAPALVALSLLAGPPASPARAQSADPVTSGATVGYELALMGATRTARGHAIVLTGVGYEVQGLSTLRPTRGLVVDAVITARRGSGQARETVHRVSARTEADGLFELSVDVPARPLSAPRLELTLHREGQPGRRFMFPLGVTDDEAVELLTDRARYQPGEDVHTWTRVRGTRSPTPRAGREVTLELFDAQGEPMAEARGTTRASGVVVADLTLPETSEPGVYRVVAEVEGSVRTQRTVQVWQRTVERMLVTVALARADEEGLAMVRPGGPLVGSVRVTTPSGTPIAGAAVQLRVRQGAAVIPLSTDAAGRAAFEVRAPTFLQGDVATETLSARATHPSYGTLTAETRYLLTRTPAVVGLVAQGGALSPEVASTFFVSVSDPRGRPLPAGTEVVVRGPGLDGDGVRAAIDDKGFAEVVTTLPRDAASTMHGGACNGQIAATFAVEVQTDPPRTTRACVRVSAEAELVTVASAPIAAPGDVVEVRIRRRASARGRPALVEAMFGGVAVASTWMTGAQDRARLALPSDLLGHVLVRARVMRAADARAPFDERGAVSFGVGSYDALLVRPANTFELSVTPERPRYLVQERARVTMRATPGHDGWAALLVRDEAAHGGEGPWDLYWMRGALHEAVRGPASAVNARFLRASLAASVGLDSQAMAPAPLETPYWRRLRNVGNYRPGAQVGRGVIRDPIALREELVRRGLGRVETALEAQVRALGADPAERAVIVDARGGRPRFDRDVIANLVAARRLSASSVITLGGEPLTVQMVEDADPGFDFNRVARRVARERLSSLLLALLRLTDPDQPQAQRASASLPPERWLGTAVRLGVVPAQNLIDPWGRPYVFRRVTGRRPVLAISERALDWELASPGPDGRLNTADDVNDPFERAVPEGTPYAVASGEENLMRSLAMIAPGPAVLARMTQAYRRLSLAANEESRDSAVAASGSESADESVRFAAPAASPAPPADPMGAAEGQGLASRSRRRTGGGSAGGGGDMGMDGMLEEAEADMEPEPESVRQQGPRRAEVLGAMVREDFPATLFFRGEVPLENGAATLEVPLADALTTYRLEAIAWTASGWTTSADARLSVDQEALVDAPTPEVATAGDRLRLPVRVENRTDAPLSVEVRVQAEGLDAELPEPRVVELPARTARESVVEVSLDEPGEGHLVVSIARDGEGIDAVRRPLAVRADARTARDRRTFLVEGRDTVTLDVPAQASERGPGQLRVAVGPRVFGELGDAAHPLWSGWAVRMAGETLEPPLLEGALGWVTYEDDDREQLRDPLSSALALSATWREARLTDPDAARALRSVASALPAPEVMRQLEPGQLGDVPSWLLLALAPVAADLGHRPELRDDVETTLATLRRLVSQRGARATDAPTVWALTAAALALGGERGRAVEMVRRCQRYRIAVGDMAWLEPEAPSGSEPRAMPTALLALAQIALGRRPAGLALVRSLVDMQRTGAPTPPPWARELGDLPPILHGRDRALAGAAAARLAPGVAPDAIEVALDGATVSLTRQGATWTAELDGIGRPGAHSLVVALPDGAVALARVASSFGMPWDVAPRRDARVALTVEGQLGARDTRSGLVLAVQNRGPRVMTEPVVEIELPAGAELDEPSRERLGALLRGGARQEGRTLILPLRPLPPGGWVRVPIPARWSVGGALRGLGAVAYDARGPDEAQVRPVSVTPSRELTIEDEGPEPDAPDAEASEDLPPRPPPIPFLDRLVPGGA